MLSYALDSTKVRIPLSKVKILSTRLQGKWVSAHINVEDGEVEYGSEDFKKLAFPVEEDGIKTKYLIERINDGRFVSDYLCILINSKLLKEDYLQGITEDNLYKIYDALKAHRVVEFTFEDFLYSTASDIDIKADFKHPKISSILNFFKAITIPSKDLGRGFKCNDRKDNSMIQWSHRRSATESCPFVKIYGKTQELIYSSDEFMHKYVSVVPDDLVRLEYTIKGKKHLQRLLGRTVQASNKLFDILTLSQEQKNDFAVGILRKHIDTNKVGFMCNKARRVDRENTAPVEAVLLSAIELGEMNGMDVSETIAFLLRHVETKQARYHWKKKISEVYVNHTSRKEDELNAEFETIDFIEELGLMD